MTEARPGDPAPFLAAEPEMKTYFEGRQISDEAALALERTGAAHASWGSSGGHQHAPEGHDGGPWLIMARGPGNSWLETLEGNCPHCGCPARAHLLNWDREVFERLKATDPLTDTTPWPDMLADKTRYRIQCKGCDEACHEMPPHADADRVLQKF